MSIIKDTSILTLKSPASIFVDAVETEKVQLNNFQVLHFLINSGKGDEVKTKARLIATNEEGTDKETIYEDEITVGNDNCIKLTIDADTIANKDFDRVFLQIDAVGVDIIGSVLVIQENERYSI
jgi:hypothetical protein